MHRLDYFVAAPRVLVKSPSPVETRESTDRKVLLCRRTKLPNKQNNNDYEATGTRAQLIWQLVGCDAELTEETQNLNIVENGIAQNHAYLGNNVFSVVRLGSRDWHTCLQRASSPRSHGHLKHTPLSFKTILHLYLAFPPLHVLSVSALSRTFKDANAEYSTMALST